MLAAGEQAQGLVVNCVFKGIILGTIGNDLLGLVRILVQNHVLGPVPGPE
jgi:hypothetical protein